jgi:K+-sensing histidine kinase KdpD
LAEERFEGASERVAQLEGQMKELKVRLTVAKAELPVGAVPESERSVLQDAMAAEVRRPLTSILGVSLALRHNDPDSRDGQELVRQLAGSARKLDRMLGVFLEIDKLKDGSLRPSRRRTDLEALVRRVVEESPDMPNRTVHIEADKVVVAVDPSMTEQMVENLLSNASSRTSSGDQVWIRVTADPEGAIIAVDDAEKVPEELRKALAAASDEDEQKRGAGRGRVPTSLTVLQRLAEVHAGRAWVEGREGGGASFRVFLPEVVDETGGQAGAGAPAARDAVAS